MGPGDPGDILTVARNRGARGYLGPPVRGSDMPRARYLSGPSVRVVNAPYGWLVLSSPHPVHRGTVSRSLGRWVALSDTVTGSPMRTFHRAQVTQALEWLGGIIGAAYRADMRSRFTPPQRLAMGRNLCPAYVDCAEPAECSVTRPDHRHLCYVPPESPVTVYCPDHDRGAANV